MRFICNLVLTVYSHNLEYEHNAPDHKGRCNGTVVRRFGVAVLMLYPYLYLNPAAVDLYYATTAETIANTIEVNREFCEDTVILSYSFEKLEGTGSAEFTNFSPAVYTDPASFDTFELTADIGGTPEIGDVYQINVQPTPLSWPTPPPSWPTA